MELWNYLRRWESPLGYLRFEVESRRTVSIVMLLSYCIIGDLYIAATRVPIRTGSLGFAGESENVLQKVA